MKILATIVGIAVLVSACGPPDDAVRTAEDASRIVHNKCYERAPVSAWHSERVDDTWIARLGEPERPGCWRFTARVKAADANAVCEVNMCALGER